MQGSADEIFSNDRGLACSIIIPEDVPHSELLHPEKDRVQQRIALIEQHFLIFPCDVSPGQPPDRMVAVQPDGIFMKDATESQQELQEYLLIQRYIKAADRRISRV